MRLPIWFAVSQFLRVACLAPVPFGFPAARRWFGDASPHPIRTVFQPTVLSCAVWRSSLPAYHHAGSHTSSFVQGSTNDSYARSRAALIPTTCHSTMAFVGVVSFTLGLRFCFVLLDSSVRTYIRRQNFLVFILTGYFVQTRPRSDATRRAALPIPKRKVSPPPLYSPPLPKSR